MAFDQGRHVYIGDAVAVRKAERLVVEIGAYPLDAAARHGFFAGVDQRDAPWLDAVTMYCDAVVPHVEGQVRQLEGVVLEVLFDLVPLMTATNHEIVQAVGRIDLHDVP